MLDVHPPHQDLHDWRDFLLHLATITLGLLIALGLEASVEWVHHRHLVTKATENIHREIEANRELLPQNLAHLEKDSSAMKQNILVIRQLRDHPRAPHGDLHYSLGWSSFADSAWRTARETGALGYMRDDELQDLSQLYSQQQYLNTLGNTLFIDQAKAPAVLAAEKSVEDLQLDQLAQLMGNTTALSAQLDALQTLLRNSQDEYNKAEKLTRK